MEFIFSLSINKYKVLAIFWNIFLALIPCFTVYFLIGSIRAKKWVKLMWSDRLVFILIFIFWLFMLPNAPYLLTIPRHLVNYCLNFDKYRVCQDGGSWIVMFFVFYSLIGVPTFYYSLKKMTDLFKNLFSHFASVLFPIFVIPLVSIALMFGLFERFNSWDVLMNPLDLIKTALSYFLDKTLFLNFLVFTIVLYLVYYGFDWFIRKIIKK